LGPRSVCASNEVWEETSERRRRGWWTVSNGASILPLYFGAVDAGRFCNRIAIDFGVDAMISPRRVLWLFMS
jgi:hypothetical protein